MILVLLPQRFMESKKSLFVLVPPILSIKNSMASTDPSGLRTLRRIHILFSRSRSTSSSSLRVPEAAIFDRREDPLVGQAPIQMAFNVPGPLDLLEDHAVHAAAGVHDGRRQVG